MNLFYRTFGTGRPLLILHGLFGLSDHWIPIAKSLSNRFRVVIPDLRNHGQSPHDPEMNYEVMHHDVLELLEMLHLSGISIAGHSMGGKLAMKLALQNPQLIDKLIVADIGVNTHSLSREMKDFISVMQNISPENYSSRTALIASLDYPDPVKELILKNLKQNKHKNISWKPNIPAIIRNMDKLSSEITSPESFPREALFLRGEYSDYIPDKDIPDIQRLFPNSKFITIPDAGHWIHADNPTALTSAIYS